MTTGRVDIRRLTWVVPIVVSLVLGGYAIHDRDQADPICASSYRSGQTGSDRGIVGDELDVEEQNEIIREFVTGLDFEAMKRRLPADVTPDIERVQAAIPDMDRYADLLAGGDGDGIDPSTLGPLLVSLGRVSDAMGDWCQ